MITITEIYQRYRIMPQLQLHQLRVAAVAQQLCESLNQPADTAGVTQACLIHDMGNIIKFNLTYYPDTVQPEGLDYWEDVKADMIRHYGPDEHAATLAIARELGVSDTIQTYLSTIGFSHVSTALHHGSLEQQICCYADQRVAPYGVVSIAERLEDGRKRYAGRRHSTLNTGNFDALARDLAKLERQVFAHSTIIPAGITNDSTDPFIETLRTTST
jgi:predicted HD phosphohydrolase